MTAPHLTRRRLLGGLGAGLASGLAGCNDGSTGSGGPGDDIPNSGDALRDATTVIGHAFPHVTDEFELNPWSPTYESGLPSLLFEYPATRRPSGERSLTDFVTEFDVDGATATVTYSDAYTWWNGDPVTARDRWVAARIDHAIGVDTGYDDVELVDDYTLRYTFPDDTRRAVAANDALTYVHNTPAFEFEEWADRLEGASNTAERDAVRSDLIDHSIGLSEAADRGIGCGPYQLREVSPNRLILERFEDHPNADDIAVPRAWFPVIQGMRVDELTNDGTLDVGQGVLQPNDDPRDLPSHIEQLDEHATHNGVALLFNQVSDHVGRRNVRRAIAAVLPMDVLNRNGEWGEPVARQTGLARPVAERWIDDAFLERLHAYPVERDDERAAAYMERAGYEREGGRWVDADGRAAQFAVNTPTWDRWSAVGQTIRQTLDDFGFDVDVDMYSRTGFFGSVQENRFQVATWRTTDTPFRAYDVTDTSLGSLGMGVTDSDRDRGDRGRPVEPTIPAEPGSLDASGDRRTLNLFELSRELRTPISTERTREILELFARWWNYELPNLQLATTSTGIWGNTRDYRWPEGGDDAYRTAGPANRVDYHLLRTGAVAPVDDGTVTDDESTTAGPD